MTTETIGKQLSSGCEADPSGRVEGVERQHLEDFEGIYKQYSKRVYSLCLRMTGNEAEAQDLTQEAFLHLFRKLDTFRGESAFYTWFHRLAVNVVLMQLRGKRRSMETPLGEITDAGDHIDLPGRTLSGPDYTLVGTIDRVSLERAIKELPTGFRVVFVLHDIEGYEHREISELVGCAVGTSKSQLHKARRLLRKLLADGSREQAQKEVLPASVPLAVGTPMQAEGALAF